MADVGVETITYHLPCRICRKPAIRIEVTNESDETVHLRNLVASQLYAVHEDCE